MAQMQLMIQISNVEVINHVKNPGCMLWPAKNYEQKLWISQYSIDDRIFGVKVIPTRNLTAELGFWSIISKPAIIIMCKEK